MGIKDIYNKTLDTVGPTAQKVANFVGAEGITEQYGADLARLVAPKSQKAFVQYPSFQKVAGSAVQSGANLIPAVGKGASLLAKGVAGATTGYLYDVGANMQLERSPEESVRPGIGAVVGGTIPILGKITGLVTKDLTRGISKKLEDISLRMTPVERQNLEKKGQDIVSYLSEKKITGTPATRYAKLSAIYENMEDKIQAEISNKRAVFFKDQIINDLKQIPEAFSNDPELKNEAINTVQRFVDNLNERQVSTLSGSTVNELKRAYMKRAFAKNATDVLSESRLAIAGVLNSHLRGAYKSIEKYNKEYGTIIASRTALRKALSRKQVGLVGNVAGIAAGIGIGNAIGGPVAGAAGAYLGPTIGKIVAGTAPRSYVGAGAQSISNVAQRVSELPTDELGNVSKKAILNLLEGLKE